ncbi:nucleotidyltransferase domain-containing protein [bacterium]|nr:nucleotidyltransferase domain-containing protein [bacterium]
MENVKKIDKKIKKATDYLISIGCKEIILFGSMAKGTVTENSDIDLAIRGISPRSYFKTVAEISSIVGQKVDLVALDYISTDFEEKIKKEGIRLYEA